MLHIEFTKMSYQTWFGYDFLLWKTKDVSTFFFVHTVKDGDGEINDDLDPNNKNKTDIFQNIFFYISQKKEKVIQVCNDRKLTPFEFFGEWPLYIFKSFK